MKIHHLRSATFIIESGAHHILIDPMLGKKGSLPPFSVFRFKAAKNPLVDMPSGADQHLAKVTQSIITHSQAFGIRPLQHTDHLDPVGENFLRNGHIPVITPSKDQAYLEKMGITVSHGVNPWQTVAIPGGKVTAVPSQHGYGWIHKLMANGAGFMVEMDNEPSIFISGDTVLTDDIRRALTELKPDYAVVPAGRAQMDMGQPLMMSKEDLLEFIRLAPNKVIANHMEALNHCPITKEDLKKLLDQHGLREKVLIPNDGDTLELQI